MKRFIYQTIPDYLKDNANCGFPADTPEDGAQTKVHGVPVVPATWRRQNPGDPPYPSGPTVANNAKGIVFSAYMDEPACKEIREKMSNANPQHQIVDDCHDLDSCTRYCKMVNATMRYKVSRISSCDVWHAVYTTDEDGNAVFDHCEVSTLRTDDPAAGIADCNSCPPSDAECVAIGLDTYSYHSYIGTKYQCTGFAPEEVNMVLNDDPKTGDGKWGAQLQRGWGWVWDPHVDANGNPVGDPPPGDQGTDVTLHDGPNLVQQWCKDKWKVEKQEYPNCTLCGPRPDGTHQNLGEECRTAPGVGSPAENPQYDPLKDPGETKRYESIRRTYTATHDLGTVPGGTSPKEYYDVNLACYDWYSEDGFPQNCIPQNLHLKKLQYREQHLNVEYNKSESSLSSALPTPPDGLSFDPDHHPKTSFTSPTLPKSDDRAIYGETPQYVSPMDRLARQLEGFAPTVQLIIPHLGTEDELAALFTGGQLNRSSGSGAPLVDVITPLQPGLIEAVRQVFRSSLLSQMEEKTIPVVIPMVSEDELQWTLDAWEGYRKKLQLINAYGGDVQTKTEQLLARLRDYRNVFGKYRELRGSILKQMGPVLQRREEVTKAVMQWVDSRMAPYNDALARASKQQELIDAWATLKAAFSEVGKDNSLYCKNDATTPALGWIEPPGKDMPDVPPFPKHLVFDFSEIYFSAANAAALITVPVLEPVQVAISLPTPPDPIMGSPGTVPVLPALPDIPDLPLPDAQTYTVDWTGVGPAPAAPPSFPFDDLVKAFQEETSMVMALNGSYNEKIWITEARRLEHEEEYTNLRCEKLGEKGCVFVEPKLWHTFMRIWSPIGGFLKPGDPPAGAALSSSSSSPRCAEDDDLCWLGEWFVKDSLRVTLPPYELSSSSTSSSSDARVEMRKLTIDDKGSLTNVNRGYAGKIDEPDTPPPPASVSSNSSSRNAPGYDIQRPQDLYDVYPVPKRFPLDFKGSSSSSSSVSGTP